MGRRSHRAGPPGGAWWGVVVLYSAAIFAASSTDSIPAGRPRFPGADKWLHFGAFALWSFFFAQALGASAPRLGPACRVALTLVATVLYGASDEIHQAFVPGRDSDGWDLAADAFGGLAGALAGLVLAAWTQRRRRRRDPSARSSPRVERDAV